MPPAAVHEATSPAPARAVLAPWLDVLVVGGASLVLLPILLVVAPASMRAFAGGTLVLLGVLFNWPHFIASYFLLYASKETIRRHRVAAIHVPVLLGLYTAAAVIVARSQPVFANLLIVVSGVYLARHYTGQAWGMMASFAHVDSVKFEPVERRLFRLDLNLLMAWHVIWAIRQSARLISPALEAPVRAIYTWSSGLLALAFLVGLAGLVAFHRRNERLPPLRVMLPWLAIHVWYLAMARDPSALFVVQIAHALQYLSFPLRVEINRAGGRPQVDWKRAAVLWGTWILLGLAVFEGLEPLFRLGFQFTGGDGPLPVVLSSAVISAIAVHHYFVDGALYKLRNPEVRRDLFAHLTRS
jgi:hypothetical protein